MTIRFLAENLGLMRDGNGMARTRKTREGDDAKALSVIRTMQDEGASYRKIAAELNSRSLTAPHTRRGGT